MEITTRNKIQTEALNAFQQHNKGTICLSTGTGKSKVAIDFIKKNLEIKNVLITSPRTNLKENWKKELTKWGLYQDENCSEIWWSIEDIQPRSIYILIENIQTAYKYSDKYDLIIADEIHTMMTPEYSRLFDVAEYKYLMGLTATHDITSKNDKGVYYKKYCPIIYEYYDSAEDGLINKTKFIIVNHNLSNENRMIVTRSKKSYEYGELEYYEYLTNRIKDGQKRMIGQGSTDWFNDASNWFWKGLGTKEQKFAAMMYLNAIKARKEFLLNIPSTIQVAKNIKNHILESVPNSKVLIFSELTVQADKISSYTVHSHNHKITNQKLIDDFNEGIIRELGSCQSLTLGLNLKGATHAIMESYIGSATQSKQKKGRLDRLATDTVAEMWIIRVVGTQSDSWFAAMTKGFDLSEAVYYNSKNILNNEFNILQEDRITSSPFEGGISE